MWKDKVWAIKFTSQKTQYQLWPFTIPVSVELELCTVPYFKAPVNVKVGLGGLKCGGTYT